MLAGFAAVFFLSVPAAILVLVRHVDLARKLGPIVLCYGAGLVIGLAGLMPDAVGGVRTSITEVSFALALPLLLFSVDMPAWRRIAGRAMLSMVLAIVAVVLVAAVLFYLFIARGMDQPEQLSAMAIGMYVGGLANLGAIKLALGIADARYLVFATVDTVIGALYLLFILTLAPRIFARILPSFPTEFQASEIPETDGDTYADLFNRAALLKSLAAVIAAGACVAAAVLAAPLLSFANQQIMVIVLLTSFGLAASFVPYLRANRFAPKVGMYLIYAFSFCLASSIDLRDLTTMDLSILAFVTVATFGSLLLHALFCRLVKIDRDTFMVTSVAAIMSPAFVPMVVRSLGNPGMLMSGVATGILGFALGNYLAISIALLLASGG